MSNSKAGSMAASMMWAFAIGSSILAVIVGRFVPGVFVSGLLAVAIVGAGGWAAVHMTQASTGKGILSVLVGALVAAVVAFFVYKAAVSSGMSQAGDAFNDAMKKAQQQQQGGQLTAEQQAQMAQAGAMLQGAGSSLAGAGAALWVLLKTFIIGMIGCFIGGATKKSAIGTSAAVSKAA